MLQPRPGCPTNNFGSPTLQSNHPTKTAGSPTAHRDTPTSAELSNQQLRWSNASIESSNESAGCPTVYRDTPTLAGLSNQQLRWSNASIGLPNVKRGMSNRAQRYSNLGPGCPTNNFGGPTLQSDRPTPQKITCPHPLNLDAASLPCPMVKWNYEKNNLSISTHLHSRRSLLIFRHDV